MGAGIAQLVERPTEKPRRNTDAGSSPQCAPPFAECSAPNMATRMYRLHSQTFLFISLTVCVSLSVSVSLSHCLCLSLSLSVSLSLTVYVSLSLSVSLSL